MNTPGSGHHTLFLSFLLCLSKPPGSRMTLRSLFLSTVCLASDFKIFGPRVVLAGRQPPFATSEDETALARQLQRWDYGVVLKTPPCTGMTELPLRGWLAVWVADGKAQGEMYGTNASFSSCKNPCNSCEDMDQRTELGKRPCGFLCCECDVNAASHRPGCQCHFRLRTPARDQARGTRLSRAEMQTLGITTLDHGFVDVPHFQIDTPGPKEAMHAFSEGRTKHLSAYTLWSLVKEGWATEHEVRRDAASFDWSPGGANLGFFRPNYISGDIFTSTKVYQADGTTWAWGPHKESKLSLSAQGIMVFTVMSTAFLRKYIPPSQPKPLWLQAWILHHHAFCMMLRYHFTFADLLLLEELVVRSERLLAEIPAYAHIWIPKAHWILHLALDIYRYGPSRLLQTLLMEMKNAHFKRGVRRSNFHNPVKSAAQFWAEQSDYQLQNATFSRSSSSYDPCDVIVNGSATSFPDSEIVSLLLAHGHISHKTPLQFLNVFTFHGVAIKRTESILLQEGVYEVLRILVTSDNNYYLWLQLVIEKLRVDEIGMPYYLPEDRACASYRLLSVHSASGVTGVFSIREPGGETLIVTRW